MTTLMLSAVLAGCFGDDGDDGGDDGNGGDGGGDGTNETDEPGGGGSTPTNTSGPMPFEPEVALDSVPDAVTTGDSLSVNWTISGTDGETVDETGLVYGQNSVAEPNATTDYNESTGVQTDVTVPANLTANVTLATNGTWYVRAYAKVGDQTYFSDEGQISVTDQEAVEIRIEPAALTSLEPFVHIHGDDDGITISVGDIVVWLNNDEEAHTISSSSVPDGADEFDTGEIAAGGVSGPIEFTVAGEYEYGISGDTSMTTYTFTVE